MQKIHGSLVTKYSFNYGIALPTDLFLNGWPYTDYTLDQKPTSTNSKDLKSYHVCSLSMMESNQKAVRER